MLSVLLVIFNSIFDFKYLIFALLSVLFSCTLWDSAYCYLLKALLEIKSFHLVLVLLEGLEYQPVCPEALLF